MLSPRPPTGPAAGILLLAVGTDSSDLEEVGDILVFQATFILKTLLPVTFFDVAAREHPRNKW